MYTNYPILTVMHADNVRTIRIAFRGNLKSVKAHIIVFSRFINHVTYQQFYYNLFALCFMHTFRHGLTSCRHIIQNCFYDYRYNLEILRSYMVKTPPRYIPVYNIIKWLRITCAQSCLYTAPHYIHYTHEKNSFINCNYNSHLS